MPMYRGHDDGYPQPGSAQQPTHKKKKRVKPIGAGKAFALGLLAAILVGTIPTAVAYMMASGTRSHVNKILGGFETDIGKKVDAQTSQIALTAASSAREAATKATANITVAFDGGDKGVQHSTYGSGIVINQTDTTAYVLTNYHVIEGASSILVTIQKDDYTATPVGEGDPRSDIAVLKIEGLAPQVKLDLANIGNSDEVQQGDWCFATGNPHGFHDSMSVGTVSAVHRNIPKSIYTENIIYANMIQTDVSMNPGNSGGGLWDAHGSLVGITSLIWSMDGGNEGLGFAIPSNYAIGVANDLIEGRNPTHAVIGASLASVPDSAVQSFGLSSSDGAYVETVTKAGPAERAGLTDGDIIIRIGDEEINSPDDLHVTVRGKTVGSDVEVTFLRQGKEMSKTLTLGAGSDFDK